jgi:hypothetical protein
MIETEADRLGLVQGLGGEEFETTTGGRFWAILLAEPLDLAAGDFHVSSRSLFLRMRTSDVEAQAIVKGKLVRRLADDSEHTVRTLSRDGSGMSLIGIDK